MPGKRRKRKRSLHSDRDDKPWISMSDEAFGSLLKDNLNHLRTTDKECEPYTICRFLKKFGEKMELEDIFLVSFLHSPKYSPFLSMHRGENLFPRCESDIN